MHETPIPTEIPFRTFQPTGALKAAIAVLILIGLAATFVAAGMEDHNRLWGSLLFNWLFWSSIAIGMVMFAVALHLTEAEWAWSVRRFALGGVAFLPIALLLMPLITYFGSEHIFHHWLHAEGDPVIDAKRAWLNLPGLMIRDLLLVGLLFGLAILFARHQLRADVHGIPSDRPRPFHGWLTSGWQGSAVDEARRSRDFNMRLGVALGLLYAIIWGIVAVDLAMSLEPHWFSTMFPVAFFMTAFHGGIAATAIAVTVLRSRMRLQEFITLRQFHDLGKLVFAFSVFWMYLNWSQYVVIWYGQLPWEQAWFIHRLNPPFASVARLVVILIFLLPFFGLLTRPPKKVPGILAFFGALILLGGWLERYMLIMPSLYADHRPHSLPLGLPEIGIALGFAGLFLACYTWFVRSFPMLPSPATLAAQTPAVVQVADTAPARV